MDDHRRIALLVEYDGTEFSGSQLQPGQRTVQGVIEEALAAFSGERQRVALAGRTDAGVHARGQVVALCVAPRHEPATVRRALNHFLPDDVAVRAACEVDADFDPRRHAVARHYAYRIVDGTAASPLRRRAAWLREQRLDVGAMSEAVAALPRTLANWAAFAGPLDEGRTPWRTLRCIAARRTAHDEVTVTMEAESFLPQQVRRTVGALERVGTGRLAPNDLARLIEGAPGSAGPTAPPQGLTLEAVHYPPDVVDWEQAA